MEFLNQPIQINQMELKNRLVMPPMATAKSAPDGMVTKPLCDYYDEKSAGGDIGLIITEHSYVSPEGKASMGQLSIAEDAAVEGLRRLTGVIHRNGSRVFAQINHAGAAATREVTGCEVIGASAVRLPNGKGELPREMDEADIADVVGAFAKAAERAKLAGFDGVEIHSAHSYLLNQFYSPLTNRRGDAYGVNSLPGRIRLHLEVIRAVREAVGTDYPVALRLGACDYMEGGSTIEDSVWAAREFEKAGIDLIDISGGLCGYLNPASREEGYFGEISEAVKKAVSIPVILTGGIVTPQAAERLLEQGKADLIGVGRAILKDSEWARRAIRRNQVRSGSWGTSCGRMSTGRDAGNWKD